MRSGTTFVAIVSLATGVVIGITAGSATAAAASANLGVQILVGTGPVTQQPPSVPNGATVTLPTKTFVAGFLVTNAGPDATSVKVRFTLPSGLAWGAEAPNPGEDCTVGEVPVCSAPLGSGADTGWGWDVTAAGAGSYVLKAEVTESSVPDSDLTNNTASVTVVVTEPSGGGGAGGGGTKVSASSVKLTPTKPKAGSLVSATVRVTAGGKPVRPTKLACAGTVGTARVKGTPKSASGSATCSYRPSGSAKGKTLRGTLSFTAQGTKFTKRFAAKLG